MSSKAQVGIPLAWGRSYPELEGESDEKPFFFLAAAIVCALIASPPARADAPQTSPLFTAGPLIWGNVRQDLQCAMQMHVSPRGFKLFGFTVKNVGSNPVTFYEDTLTGFADDFVVTPSEPDLPPTGKISHDGSNAVYTVGGRKLETKLAPGETATTQYQFGYDSRLQHGSYGLSFSGSLQPVGARAAIPLSCGPIPFNT
jgi:hypothetical protein